QFAHGAPEQFTGSLGTVGGTMAHPFLSEEWMNAARSIREKYADEVPEVEADLRINQIVTDVPFGDDVVHSHLDTTSGTVVMELGLLDEADVTVTTDYDTAKALFVDQDPAVAMQSFMNGQVKVQGDMMKLMAMQTSLPSNDFTDKISEEIKAITE
ncbi:SCP2 sterol-binding domain-containing protein, partial [Ilumatobacter nonamiensis]|uniref:SCP2 sterol-binding domain-containing protein n=1 Tax=Ilumatobacter nonamiensis TaxID=467093 RepID=UPI0019D36C9F